MADSPEPTPENSPALPTASERLVAELLHRGVEGLGPWHPARDAAADALVAAGGDVEAAVRALVASHVRLAAGSGLLTSLGGALTMVVTAPAGVTSLYLVSTRLAAAIASVRGHDVDDPAVRTAILLCLLGSDGTELCARTGIDTEKVSVLAGLRRLPRAVHEQLDKRIGYRLAGRFTRRGALNVTKLLPIVSGPISAGADGIATRTVGTYATVAFPPRAAPSRSTRS